VLTKRFIANCWREYNNTYDKQCSCSDCRLNATYDKNPHAPHVCFSRYKGQIKRGMFFASLLIVKTCSHCYNYLQILLFFTDIHPRTKLCCHVKQFLTTLFIGIVRRTFLRILYLCWRQFFCVVKPVSQAFEGLRTPFRFLRKPLLRRSCSAELFDFPASSCKKSKPGPFSPFCGDRPN